MSQQPPLQPSPAPTVRDDIAVTRLDGPAPTVRDNALPAFLFWCSTGDNGHQGESVSESRQPLDGIRVAFDQSDQ